MIKILLLVLLSEFFNAVGQILFKKSTGSFEPFRLRGILSYLRFLKGVIAMPAVWGGILSMVAGLFAWLVALGQADLSLVYAIGSAQYIFVLVLAHALLGERVDFMKFTGTLLIVMGIALASMS